jgi:sigma-B regulation protein RsbU (phosphoserine phosphatase)
MRLSIRWKLVLTIAIPLAVVYAAMLWVVAVGFRERTVRNLEETIGRLARLEAARLGERLAVVRRGAEGIAAALALEPPLDERRVAETADDALVEDPLVHASRVAWRGGGGHRHVTNVTRDAQGAIVPESHVLAEGAPWPAWAEQALAHDAPAWLGPMPADGDPSDVVAGVAVPIGRGAAARGVILVEVTDDALAAELRRAEPSGGELAILNRDAHFVTPPPIGAPRQVSLAAIAERAGRPDFLAIAHDIEAGRAGVTRAPGLLVPGQNWVRYAPVPGTPWAFTAVVSDDTVLASARRQIDVALGVMLAGLAAILGLIWLAATRITRPLVRLSTAVAALGRGDLEVSVSGVDERDEIGDLALAFNRMTGDLKHHVDALTHETAERVKVEGELQLAREIQTALLPAVLPTGDGFTLAARNTAARHVAGDFYDAFLGRDGRLAFVVADVSGKGAPAAMFMAVAKTLLHDLLTRESSLPEAFVQANAALARDNVRSMFVTLFAGWYEPASGALAYVNAGHPPPLRIAADGAVAPFGEGTAPLLGVIPGAAFPEAHGRLAPGDRLVIVTDGVAEARAPDGEFYGEQRFAELLGRESARSPQGLIEALDAAVSAFQRGALSDDVTLMVLERRVATPA